MEVNKNKENKILWRPALEVFSEISVWIVVPIIIAVVAGKFLDKNYGTSPWFMVFCSAFAFLLSSYGIVSSVKKFAAKINKK